MDDFRDLLPSDRTDRDKRLDVSPLLHPCLVGDVGDVDEPPKTHREHIVETSHDKIEIANALNFRDIIQKLGADSPVDSYDDGPNQNGILSPMNRQSNESDNERGVGGGGVGRYTQKFAKKKANIMDKSPLRQYRGRYSSSPIRSRLYRKGHPNGVHAIVIGRDHLKDEIKFPPIRDRNSMRIPVIGTWSMTAP